MMVLILWLIFNFHKDGNKCDKNNNKDNKGQ